MDFTIGSLIQSKTTFLYTYTYDHTHWLHNQMACQV